MRKSSVLDALFPAVRQGVLAATLMHADQWWYMSDLAAHLGRTPSSLQRELASLTGAGVLESRVEGNRVYYRANSESPFFAELKGLLTKTLGVVEVLREALAPLSDDIQWALVYGSVARQEEQADSDVDLMVIGKLRLSDAASHLKQAEQKLGRPVNASLYPKAEFTKKLRSGQHFSQTVVQNEKLFILGDAREFAAAFATPKNTAASNKSKRTR
jgi:DNA-binding transcriptional ArsR family regulator